jgi:hypothetical protein
VSSQAADSGLGRVHGKLEADESERIAIMHESEPTDPTESPSELPVSSTTARPPDASTPRGAGGTPPAPSESASELADDHRTSVTTVKQPRRAAVWRVLSNRKTGPIVAAAVLAPVLGLTFGLATSPLASAAQPVSGSVAPHSLRSGGGGSNARSGPAAGGATGTISSLSTSGFTMTTSAGQKVTVTEASSTKYLKGGNTTSKSTLNKGKPVLVLGTTSGTTIKATEVIVETTSGRSATSTTAKVIPFQRGTPTTSKQVGQIPASYRQGSGTIVSGTTANKATEAALAAYPGGVVDRVVKLSNGEYEVHYIGVNWPHHIFVNSDFKVVGAD